MSKEKETEIRKQLFRTQAKITWAGTDEDALTAFKQLMELREEYRQAGGEFKK